MAADAEPPLDFRASITRPDGEPLKLIAELKKASPSKGLIRQDFDVESLSLIYKRAGAAALSVLTEEDFFQGSIDFLPIAKKASGLPVLRKDFIIDEYQIYEARAYGADAVLLIGASLERGQIEELSGLAGELGLAVLHEVHNHEELEVAISAGQRIIGINNRDLTTLKIDLNTTKKLLPYIPDGVVRVSESGISTPEDAIELNALRLDAVLVGTALMSSDDVGAKIREVFGKIWYNG
ncbi:MAG: indole-3-glycerol phosphate synthase TrpC [Nitrospirae bacterium]|nr:MAG: indole-3-glycerol phosphate synthase TrpC [Nitrospirota bacterium]